MEIFMHPGFRAMRQEDIEAGLRLCRASRWNQTACDWEIFLKLSPDGCRVAVKNGQVIGTVTTIRYENRFAWIGMVLVDPEERGHGVGSRLMSEALDLLKDMPSIRLDATPAGRGVYRRLDFVDEYHLSRMEIAAEHQSPALQLDDVRPMSKEDLPAIAKLDREVFGADRRILLEWMFESAPEYAWVSQERDRGQVRIAGYMFGRHGFNYSHLGPVIADNQQGARQLISACLSRRIGKQFILDASLHTTEWRSWLESVGFKEQRPFIRMYNKANPFPGMPLKQFAILGPEFG
jgi:ribosomal protein S18 acetylase RimI-like enzyme